MKLEHIEARIAKVEQLLHDDLEHLGEFGEEHLLLCSEKQEYAEVQASIASHQAKLNKLKEQLQAELQKAQEEFDKQQLKLPL